MEEYKNYNLKWNLTFTTTQSPEDIAYDKWFECWRSSMVKELAEKMITSILLIFVASICIYVLPYFLF